MKTDRCWRALPAGQGCGCPSGSARESAPPLKRPPVRPQMLAMNLSIAWRCLRAHRLRSLLTMLGIIIGVAAVVTMVAVAAGARDRISAQIRSLGANAIGIVPGSAMTGGARLGKGTVPYLSQDDAVAIAANVSGLVAVAPVLASPAQFDPYCALFGGRNIREIANDERVLLPGPDAVTLAQQVGTRRGDVLSRDTISKLGEDHMDHSRTGAADANELLARRRERHEGDVILVVALDVLAFPRQHPYDREGHISDCAPQRRSDRRRRIASRARWRRAEPPWPRDCSLPRSARGPRQYSSRAR
jgi:hypothetical protein